MVERITAILGNLSRRTLILIGIAFFLLLFLLILLVASLTGGDTTTPTVTTTNPTTNTTNTGTTTNTANEIIFWGLWEPESVMQPIIDQYEAANPGVKITYVQKSYTLDYPNVSFTRIAQGAVTGEPAPDILEINNSWTHMYQPLLSPLPEAVMPSTQYRQTFYPTHVTDFTGKDGNIYAVPMQIDGLALFYNKELLEQAGITPPTDWDSFIENAKALTQADINGNIEIAGAALGTSANVTHAPDILNLLFLQNNVPITDPTTGLINLNNQQAQTALNFYTAFDYEHQTWSSDLRVDLEMFYQGKLAMMFAPSWRAFDILLASPSIEFGLAPVPQSGNTEVNHTMSWGLAVPKSSQKSLESWKFINYLTQAQQLQDFYSNSSKIRAFGQPYSRQDLNSQMQSGPYVPAIAQMAPTMSTYQMYEQEETLKELRDVIFSAEGRTGGASTALSVGQENINAIWSKYLSTAQQ